MLKALASSVKINMYNKLNRHFDGALQLKTLDKHTLPHTYTYIYMHLLIHHAIMHNPRQLFV